jgi:hypothetical protein
MLFSAFVCAGAARAADDCGPGCHSTVQGACVVNGWEVGAGGWNECPAGARPRPPCRPGLRLEQARQVLHPFKLTRAAQ